MSATFEQIIADYTDPIATAVGITLTETDRTPAGFPGLLERAAGRLSPMSSTGEWLTEAADNLNAINRLGSDDIKTQALLATADSMLYDARADLESM